MARPSKIGLDYFPFDVDMFDDEKVIPISSEFGAKGECVVVRVLCAIYRNGYFAEWSDAFKFKIAKQASVSASLVASVISGLVKWGFFNESLFSSVGIITSKGIQRRWKEATRRRVSKGELDYWLIDDENVVSDDRNPRNSEFMYTETPVTLTETPQSKLKESKELKDTYRYLVELWNSTCSMLPSILKITKAREGKMRLRLNEFADNPTDSLEVAKRLFEKVRDSKFMQGENKNKWSATFDWLFENSTNWVKVLEGNYDERAIVVDKKPKVSALMPYQLNELVSRNEAKMEDYERFERDGQIFYRKI